MPLKRHRKREKNIQSTKSAAYFGYLRWLKLANNTGLCQQPITNKIACRQRKIAE